MKVSMTRQEKCDLLIQMTAWASLTVIYIGYTINYSCLTFRLFLITKDKK